MVTLSLSVTFTVTVMVTFSVKVIVTIGESEVPVCVPPFLEGSRVPHGRRP